MTIIVDEGSIRAEIVEVSAAAHPAAIALGRAIPIRPSMSRACSVEPNPAIQCWMPVKRNSVLAIATPGTISKAILVGVIGESLFPDCHQSGSLTFIGLDPAGAVNQQAEQQRALLVAQTRLGDQTAKLYFFARVLLAGFALADLLHPFKPRYPTA